MKRRAHICSLISLSTASAFQTVGEVEADTTLRHKLKATTPDRLNSFGMSSLMGLNMGMRFNHLEESLRPHPRQTLDGDPYNFDTGHICPDAGKANSGLTRYWGSGRFTCNCGALIRNGKILTQRPALAGIDSRNNSDDILSGVELIDRRELLDNRGVRWGLEAACDNVHVGACDTHPIIGQANLPNDTYSRKVPESLLPSEEHQRRKDISGMVTASDKQTCQNSTQEIVSCERNIDAHIFGYQVGPSLEHSPDKRWTFGLGASLSAAELNSDFQFAEKIQAGTVGIPVGVGSGSQSDWAVGGYVLGTIASEKNRSTSVDAGVQLQDLGTYSLAINGQEAVMDLSKSIFVSLGLSYSF